MSLDLLVAAVALPHNAVLVSFDADFEAIVAVSALRLQRLERPTRPHNAQPVHRHKQRIAAATSATSGGYAALTPTVLPQHRAPGRTPSPGKDLVRRCDASAQG